MPLQERQREFGAVLEGRVKKKRKEKQGVMDISVTKNVT